MTMLVCFAFVYKTCIDMFFIITVIKVSLSNILHRVIKKFSERSSISAREHSREGSLSYLGSTMCPLSIGEKQTPATRS